MLHAEIKSAKLYWQHFFFGKKKFLINFKTFFTISIYKQIYNIESCEVQIPFLSIVKNILYCEQQYVLFTPYLFIKRLPWR